MLGIFLTLIGTVLEEAGNSLAKASVKLKIESVNTLGFLSNSWSTIFFVALTVIRWPEMHIATWPTLLLRLPLEIIPAWFTVRAIAYCARSTFGFVRVTTIPLLLLADMVMGYHLDPYQMMGISLITFTLLFLYANHGFDRRGLFYAFAASLMPVVTSTLLKYNLNHGNSLELEQAMVGLTLTAYFYLQTRRAGEKPFRLLSKPIVLSQVLVHALGGVVLSYGFNLITPSVHMAAKRSTTVMASLVSGRYVFKEKKMGLKIAAMAICVLGIILLAI
jgi:hypothetical protein